MDCVRDSINMYEIGSMICKGSRGREIEIGTYSHIQYENNTHIETMRQTERQR